MNIENEKWKLFLKTCEHYKSFNIINGVLEDKLMKILKTEDKIEIKVEESDELYAFSYNNKIYLNKGLIYNLNKEELESVILHEVCHILNKDGEKYTFIIMCLYILLFIGFILLILMSSYFSPHSFLSIFMILISCIYYWLIFFNIPEKIYNILFSKKKEYRCDAFVVSYKYGNNLISALKKIVTYKQRFFGSHPSLKSRIKNIEINMKKGEIK